ncbi:MAG: hypothetical protein JO199_14465 [Candidatus Eremiobacteraeota bacterium]|nr:hypothetical protein [Candidatus Eremiobacteraeota bacterium]
MYAAPVTVTDSDSSSLTLGTALAVGGGTPGSSVILNTSTDAGNLTLNYGGLDIAPATISASTQSVSSSNLGSFKPSVAAIVYSGPSGTISSQEVDLSTQTLAGNWTDSQAGWTNSPYDETIGESDNCTSSGNAVATLAQTGSSAGGTAWTATEANAPAVGSCTVTLTGGAGASLGVTVTYTAPIPIGINFKHGKAITKPR